jgi:hypothetical protein
MKSEDCANRVLSATLTTPDGLGYAGDVLTLHLLTAPAPHAVAAGAAPYPGYQGQPVQRSAAAWKIDGGVAMNRARHEFPRAKLKPGETIMLNFWALTAPNGDTVRHGNLPGGVAVHNNTIPAAFPEDIVITEE